jgi:hypothetical protein
VDFKNGQAVRADLRACKAYKDRGAEEQLYRIVRSLEAIHTPAGATEAQLRATRPSKSRAVVGRRRARFARSVAGLISGMPRPFAPTASGARRIGLADRPGDGGGKDPGL